MYSPLFGSLSLTGIHCPDVYKRQVDKENPRIEVTITELTAEQAKMTLKDLLKDLETG